MFQGDNWLDPRKRCAGRNKDILFHLEAQASRSDLICSVVPKYRLHIGLVHGLVMALEVTFALSHALFSQLYSYLVRQEDTAKSQSRLIRVRKGSQCVAINFLPRQQIKMEIRGRDRTNSRVSKSCRMCWRLDHVFVDWHFPNRCRNETVKSVDEDYIIFSNTKLYPSQRCRRELQEKNEGDLLNIWGNPWLQDDELGRGLELDVL